MNRLNYNYYPNNALAIIPTNFFCSEEDNYCSNIFQGTLLKRDEDHLNEYGSVFLAKLWESSDDFPFEN